MWYFGVAGSVCGAVHLDDKLGTSPGYCMISWVPVQAIASIQMVRECSRPETCHWRTAAGDSRGGVTLKQKYRLKKIFKVLIW